MADVHTTVKHLLAVHPLRFGHAADVLEYLLCGLGSGYAWVNGEVVDMHEHVNITEETVREVFGDSYYTYNPGISSQVTDEERQQLINQRKHVLNNLDDLANWFGDVDVYNVPPQTPDALISNIPDDITEDWLTAVNKLKPILATVGWKF